MTTSRCYEVARWTAVDHGATVEWGLTLRQAQDVLRHVGDDFVALHRPSDWAVENHQPHSTPVVEYEEHAIHLSMRGYGGEHDSWYASYRIREDGGIASHPSRPQSTR